jgi:hypothetical protein
MPEEQLKVGITGDASGLEAASKQAVSSLDKIDKSATATAASLNKVPQVSQKISQAAAQISTSAAKMGGSVAKGANEATLAMTNFGRIVQDAPFGFLGISNNLNPMLESFQRLKASTGSAGSALKAMGSSLVGAGGLGIAVSVVSTLLILFGDKLFKSGTAAEDQAAKIKKAREALDNYTDSLNDLDRSRVKGLQNAQEELVNLKTLYDATQNTNISIAQRKKLVDELQEQYPKYFANISDEIILAGGAKKAYNELATAILASAKARAAQETLVDINKQVLAVDQEVSVNTANQIKLQQQLNALKGKGLTETSATGEERLTAAGAKATKLQSQLNDFVTQGNGFLKQRNDLLSRANVLSKSISTQVQENPDALLKTGGKIEAPKVDKSKAEKDNKDLEKLLKEKQAILLQFVKDFESIGIHVPSISDEEFKKLDVKGLIDLLRDKLEKAANQLAPIKIKLPVDPVIGMDLKKIPIPLKPTIIWQDTDLHSQLTEFGQVGNKIGEVLGHGFGDVFQKIFEQSMTDAVLKGMSGKALENFKGGLTAVAVVTSEAFNGLGDAFGNLTSALLKGQNGVKAFGDSLKNTFSQLAAQLIKTIALAAILSLVTGGASNVAKGGLSFLGSFKKLLGFAKGGMVPGQGSGDTVPAMLTPGEFVVPKKFAKLAAMMFDGGFKLPKMNNNRLHFAEGGFVPNIERTSPVQRINNIINPTPVSFPDYLPVIQYSYDSMRIGYQRANKAKTLFGG